jgi:hypothetical protein
MGIKLQKFPNNGATLPVGPNHNHPYRMETKMKLGPNIRTPKKAPMIVRLGVLDVQMKLREVSDVDDADGLGDAAAPGSGCDD